MSKYTPSGSVKTRSDFQAEFTKIAVAMESQLDKAGGTGNAMRADLDMNSYRILNLPAPASDNEPARLIDLNPAIISNLDGYLAVTEETLVVSSDQLIYTFPSAKPVVGSGFFIRNTAGDLGARLISGLDFIFRPDISVYTIELTRSWESGLILQRVYNSFSGASNYASLSNKPDLQLTSSLEAAVSFGVGEVVTVSETGAKYILRDTDYTPLAGDYLRVDSRVWELLPSSEGGWNVKWFGAQTDTSLQSSLFNAAAFRAKLYTQQSTGLNLYGRVDVPVGNWNLGVAVENPAIWYVQAGAEFTTPTNYSGNNLDNLSYLTGYVVKTTARGETGVMFGSQNLQWVQDIRNSILGTAMMTVSSPTGGPAILATTRTSDSGASQGTIAVTSYVANDNEDDVGVAYGHYKECIRWPDAGTTLAEESNVTTYGTMVPIYPNDVPTDTDGYTVNYWCGGPVSSGPLDGVEDKAMSSAGFVFSPGGGVDVDTGLRLGFDAGIVFLNKSFETSPEKEIIRAGSDMQLAWYGDGGTRTAGIKGSTETSNGVLRVYARRASDARVTNFSFNSGNFSPDDNEVNLGSASRRWVEVFSINGAINTSDEREKQQITDLSVAEKAVALVCKGLIKKFKWNSAVELKGEGARWHVGAIAQEVEQAFIDGGLDPEEYGIFCYDEFQEDGQQANRYGIRYTELLAFIIGAL